MLAAAAPLCACKGIRSCNLCETKSEKSFVDEYSSHTIYIYCDGCRQAVRMDIYEANNRCPHHNDLGNSDRSIPIDGIYLMSDFVSEQEENQLIEQIDKDIWIASQSGRLKQDFGIKINFKKQTIKTKYFTGMPWYSVELLERLRSTRLLKDFQSVELCHLDYQSERGSHIDPHIDDIWIWGERLITINLLSDTILTLIPNDTEKKQMIYIPLPRRWLIVLYGDARYEYKHAIQRQHIHQRRVAVTFRELTGKDEKFYEENKELYERILRISQRVTGISVGRFDKIANENQFVEKNDSISIDLDRLKSFLESQLNTSISSLTKLNSSTYSMINDDERQVKLISSSLINIDQLKSLVPSSVLNETFDENFLVVIDRPNDFQGKFLAQWRLLISSKNSFDQSWWKKYYSTILEEKKSNYPYLIANLFTCEEQLKNNSLDIGLLWSNNEISYHLLDLASLIVDNLHSFPENLREIVHSYEEILPLTSEEFSYLDCFVRLQLVVSIVDRHYEDEKHWDCLELLSNDLNFVRNRIR